MMASAVIGWLAFMGHRLLRVSLVEGERERANIPIDICIAGIEGQVKSILSIWGIISTNREVVYVLARPYMLALICTLHQPD